MAKESGSAFRKDVQGLRAVAILLVVLYHVGVPGLGGGYVGVDVFFVISGFLITGQLTRELAERGRLSFAGFYARRARRILPAALLTVSVTALASAVILNPLYARRTVTDSLAATFFVANFRFAAEKANYFSSSLPASPLQHFWSLSVEEQFYLVWPLLLVVASLVWLGRAGARSGRRLPSVTVVSVVLVVVAAASLAAALTETTRSPELAYYSILTRGWELAVGALVALALPAAGRLGGTVGAGLSWAGLAAIVGGSVLYTPSTPYPGYAALLPVAGAAAVIVGGSALASVPRTGARLLLDTGSFQHVGAWSYSWYLWHWPFLILAPYVVGHPLTTLEALGVAALSLGAAVASYVLVERPLRRLQLVVRRPRLGLTGAGCLAGAAVAAVLVAGSLIPSLAPTGAASGMTPAAAQRPAGEVPTGGGAQLAGAADRDGSTGGPLTPAELTADLEDGLSTKVVPSDLTPPLAEADDSLPLIVRNGCHLQHAGIKSKPCIYGDRAAKTDVVLFGDSHAAAWFPALDEIAVHEHWRLVDISKAGCPPVEVAIVLGSAAYTNCTKWRSHALTQIRALHPALVFVAWARYLEYPEARALPGVPDTEGSVWADGVDALFKFLHGAARHTVFLSDGPTLPWLAPDCVAGHLKDVEACTVPRSKAVLLPKVKAQELAIGRRDGIVTVDPTGWFCAPKACPVIVGNIILYRDMAHMVPAWSDFIAPVLAGAIVPVVTGKPPAGGL